MQTPLSDSIKVQFRAAVGSLPPGSIDKAAGAIRGASLITADREASGHGLWIDAKTLNGFNALLTGRRLKAYATHAAVGRDATLSEVGYWDCVRVDGANLRANFTALDAWRKGAPSAFDTLFEMAEKLPAEFGASLSFSYTPCWVLPGGNDVPTKRTASLAGAGYNPPAPSNAVRKLPSVRAKAVYSADFVDTPAANNGLFSAGRAGDLRDPARPAIITITLFNTLPPADRTRFILAGGRLTDDTAVATLHSRDDLVSSSAPTLTRKQFDALAPADRLQFCQAGGALKD